MVYLILFFVSFISATLFPLGSEALLIYDIKEGYNIYLLLIFATLGNSLGSIVNYYLGLKGEEYLIEKNLIKKEEPKEIPYNDKIVCDKIVSWPGERTQLFGQTLV